MIDASLHVPQPVVELGFDGVRLAAPSASPLGFPPRGVGLGRGRGRRRPVGVPCKLRNPLRNGPRGREDLVLRAPLAREHGPLAGRRGKRARGPCPLKQARTLVGGEVDLRVELRVIGGRNLGPRAVPGTKARFCRAPADAEFELEPRDQGFYRATRGRGPSHQWRDRWARG